MRVVSLIWNNDNILNKDNMMIMMIEVVVVVVDVVCFGTTT